MLTLRFDMRAPAFGAPTPELYSAAVDMAGWAEQQGASNLVLSEHHGTDDGHLPAPMVLAAAMAARTERLSILLAAIVLPLYDVVRLAEDISVLDIISRGRVSYVFGVGHRPEEYEHFGVDIHQRGALADEKLGILRELLTGDPVEYQGRSVRVTPPPLTAGGPRMMVGGGSLAAARRAGRFGLILLAQANPPGLREAYEEACRAHGHAPVMAVLPDPDTPTAVFVAADVDAAWAELGPHLLHDATMAASYRHAEDGVASISRATDIEALRAAGGAYRVLSVDAAADRLRAGERLPLAPLCGGLPAAAAWRYLDYAAEAVKRSQS